MMRNGTLHVLVVTLLFAGTASPQDKDCWTASASSPAPCLSNREAPALRGGSEIGPARAPVVGDATVVPQAREEIDSHDAHPPKNAILGQAPDEPTEFQKFVEQAIERSLPIFGAELFRQAPSTFAPVDQVPVAPDYRIGPGDQLIIRGWGQISLAVSPVVDRSGGIYIPQIGEVQVAGLKFGELSDYLKASIGRIFRNFEVSVGLGRLRTIQVFVTGHARRPGAYTVSSLSTLVNAIFASGGPDRSGSMRDIRLIRGGELIVRFDLYDLLVHGDKSKDNPLLPGDVIHIAPVGPQVAMAGSVNAPGIYEIREGSTLAEALALAGGLSPVAARQRVVIERIDGETRRALQASLETEEAGRTTLRGGDVVSILAVTPRYENTVALRGNVLDPVRLPWRPGMKIRDLIPGPEALLSRDYWLVRNRLVPSAPSTGIAGDGAPPHGNDSSSEFFQSEGPSPIRLAGLHNVSDAASSTLLESRSAAYPRRPGPAQVEQPEVKNRIERSSLEVNWDYAVIERRNPRDLKTTLVPFRLGRAVLDGDESENLSLEPGDVVNVFSTSDLRTPQNTQNRYVRLEGEIISAGVYSVKPGETLRQLVERAGGLTPQAYLFGAEFLRESSRVEQQQRLSDLADSLERQAASLAANFLGSVVSPEQASAASLQATGQRELVSRMRRLRASGRIVLGVSPDSTGLHQVPDIQLEDGDVFIVPSRPAFVNVVGSVYNGASFIYEEHARVRDYLRKAGGPTRSADKRSMFVIRADGSVLSKSMPGGVTGGSFEELRLHPGDTIVVPEQMNKTALLRGLKDWSLVFSQFGLGAAAINILR